MLREHRWQHLALGDALLHLSGGLCSVAAALTDQEHQGESKPRSADVSVGIIAN